VYRRGYYGAWYGSPYVWVPGYWNWGGATYVWVDGNWALPPHHGQVWVPGQWVSSNDAWAWEPGHWVAPPAGEGIDCDDATQPCPRDEEEREEHAAPREDSQEPRPAPPAAPDLP
jgi:hypothetical protein